jgi:hypothetical protein
MEFKEGMKVIFTGKLKMLDEGTVGIITKLYSDWCSIAYPQNLSFEEDGKGGWKPIKGAPNKVYAHSVKLTEIKFA